MKRSISIILCIILALCLFCGCGASAPMDMLAEPAAPAAPAEPAAPATGNAKLEMDYGYYETPASASDISSGSLPANTKLIYTANLGLETTAFDESIAKLENLVKDMGGYIESSSVNNYGTYRHASYSIRVPAASFDPFCSAVGQLCQLKTISRSAEDVSEAYYDTESRLITQQTKLDRLQMLLAKATNMEDIIDLEGAISETELQIERLTGTLRKYDSLVSYSTIHIGIDEVYELTEVEEPVIGFGAKLSEAFQRGTSNFVDSLQRSLLRFARNWVGTIIWLVILAVAAFFVIRHIVKKHRAKAAKKSAAKPAAPAPEAKNEGDKK